MLPVLQLSVNKHILWEPSFDAKKIGPILLYAQKLETAGQVNIGSMQNIVSIPEVFAYHT